MKELQTRLLKVQEELKAPKNQRNNFGKYNYRSCEDILEAVKPLLVKHGLLITIADQVHEIGNYMYVESTVMVSYENDRIAATAQAGIDPNRKGMDIAQSFGSSSSYARKYALNGMFLIDDTKDAKDADATNTHGKAEVTKTVTKKKATKQVITAMKKAVAEGKKQAVLERIMDYELSEQDVMDIMKAE
jgi:hypothetical protein